MEPCKICDKWSVLLQKWTGWRWPRGTFWRGSGTLMPASEQTLTCCYLLLFYMTQSCWRITEPLKLEKTSEIIKSNGWSSIARPTPKLYPQVPYPYVFQALPGTVISPLSWASCSSAWPKVLGPFKTSNQSFNRFESCSEHCWQCCKLYLRCAPAQKSFPPSLWNTHSLIWICPLKWVSGLFSLLTP